MDSTASRRPSLLTVSLKNSFRKLKGLRTNSSKFGDVGSPDSEDARSPITTERRSSGVPDDIVHNPKDVPFSPISLDTKETLLPASIANLMGRRGSDPQRKHDSSGTNGSSGRSRSSNRMSRLRRVVQVNDAEKVNLISRLRSTLYTVEKSLHLSEKDLESQLEENDFHIDKAASDALERTGLRQIEPNTTLKRVEYQDDKPGITNSWSTCDPTVFSVRYGPQYRKSKIKAPAKPQTLYDMVAVDFYSAEEKMEHISRFMKLGDLEQDECAHPLPSIFIVNFMLPMCEPRLFSGDANGPTLHFQFIMKLSDWAKQNPDHPSVQLASRFVNDCGPNGSMRERLKIIVQVANPDEMTLGKVERGLCRQYNGLPFLYRAYNSSYHRGYGWFQATFDGHRSGYTTRYARYSLLAWAEQIVANIAILVEAETDDEMPERVLGCANVHRLFPKSAKPFVKPSATPLSPRSARKRDHTSSLRAEADFGANAGKGSRGESLISETDDDFRDAISEVNISQ